MKLLLSLIQSFSLAALIYFSAAFAYQINLGEDIEGYIGLLVIIAAIVYGLIDWQKSK